MTSHSTIAAGLILIRGAGAPDAFPGDERERALRRKQRGDQREGGRGR
ncbi:hypothetical protein [Microbispora rosea]